MSPRPGFRALHAGKTPLVMPAAHDALSARLIETAGFPALAGAGSAMLAARYALPDLGIVGLGEMEAANRDVIAATRLPCLVDADDGYGDVKSVVRTVRANETIGAAAIVFEDQARAIKRPGQDAAQAVVGEEEIAAKLRVAVATRDDPDMWILGRTDAYATQGLDGALRRAELLLGAGADGLFVAGVRTEADLAAVGTRFAGTPLLVVMYGIAGWPALDVSDLAAMGYTMIVYPQALLLPVCSLMADTLEDLRRRTEAGGRPAPAADADRGRNILQQAVQLDMWSRIGD